mmetsp:Transcript_4629/g.8732  ORF Transcript_4629/g.8732 Transcript_4629/m.8732 type:complete len:853 (+) Transcript_4629:419-2977(+)
MSWVAPEETDHSDMPENKQEEVEDALLDSRDLNEVRERVPHLDEVERAVEKDKETVHHPIENHHRAEVGKKRPRPEVEFQVNKVQLSRQLNQPNHQLLFGGNVSDSRLLEVLCVASAERHSNLRGILDFIGKDRLAQLLRTLDTSTLAARTGPGTPLFEATKVGLVENAQALLDYGVPVDQIAGASIVSPLFLAAAEGNLPLVRILCKAGANPNLRHPDGSAVIHVAVRSCNVHIVRTLYEYGADPHLLKSNSIGTLHMACQADALDICSALVQEMGVDMHRKNKSGSTPLHLAVFQRHNAIVEFLIKCGVDVDMADNHGWTPTHVAAQSGSLKILTLLAKAPLVQGSELSWLIPDIRRELLLPDGFDDGIPVAVFRLNRRKLDQYTPLMVAVRSGSDPSLLRALMDLGASPSIELEEVVTPLMIAAKYGNLEHMKLLIERLSVAEILRRTRSQHWSILHFAANAGHVGIVQFLLNLRRNTTGEPFFNVEEPSRTGMTPLYIAAHHGHVAVIDLLVNSFGADMHRSLPNGTNALYTSCKHGQLAVVKYLLAHNCPVQSEPSRRGTPLHTACKYNRVEIVKHLISHASLSPFEQFNAQGWAPVHSAASANAREVIEFLVSQFGAQVVLSCETRTSNAEAGFRVAHLAASNGCIALLRYFAQLELGLPQPLPESEVAPPANLASRNGHTVVARWITCAAKWNTVQLAADMRDFEKIQNMCTTSDVPFKVLSQGLQRDSPLALALAPKVESIKEVLRVAEPFFSLRVRAAPGLTRKLLQRALIDSRKIGLPSLAICGKTVSVLLEALLPWAPASHATSFGPGCRLRVRTFLLCNMRRTPRLPSDIVLNILSFLRD